MKKKIKLIDKINNKVLKGEITVRDLDHLQAQQKYPSRVFINKKKLIPRKEKYRKDGAECE